MASPVAYRLAERQLGLAGHTQAHGGAPQLFHCLEALVGVVAPLTLPVVHQQQPCRVFVKGKVLHFVAVELFGSFNELGCVACEGLGNGGVD